MSGGSHPLGHGKYFGVVNFEQLDLVVTMSDLGSIDAFTSSQKFEKWGVERERCGDSK